MSLASVIRLEFAYPGVGILAGDSLQYLSIATAHGVIMVFFMIMPVVFGAFGNFLLPTQLGVHDVAFPRLNSAAFWFLPGGLIMLMQLVCVDRRYQRMNCFNIRELQGVLKRKFFTDLINTNDHRDFLNQSIIGLRFKSNNNLATTPDMEAFFNLGTTASAKSKTLSFDTVYSNLSMPNVSILSYAPYLPTYHTTIFYMGSVINIIGSVNFQSFITLTQVPTIFKSIAGSNCSINLNFSNIFMSLSNLPNTTNSLPVVTYSTDNLNASSNSDTSNMMLSETSNNVRFTRFNNPLISYDYKCGHYLGI
jgi:hypothetical protein